MKLQPLSFSQKIFFGHLRFTNQAKHWVKYGRSEKHGPCPWITAAAAAKSLQSCPTLCNPIDVSPPGSRVPGILQARTLEWVAISFSNAWKWKVKGKLLSHVRLCDPMDCSLPGSSIHGIFQARVLECGVPLPSLPLITSICYLGR